MNFDDARDAYPLSPMQAGMLFQYLRDSKNGVNIEQLVCGFSGVDVSALRRAWEQVWQINDVLRLGFEWRGLNQPLQRAHDNLTFPWNELDWRSEPNPQAALQDFLRLDRLTGFELDRPPLLRLTLIRRGETDFWLVWTYHHILLDGRSILLLLKQMAESYQARINGETVALPPSRPFRDYIRWLEGLDMEAARSYWRMILQDAQPSMSLAGLALTPSQRAAELPFGVEKTHLSVELTNALRRFAETHSLSLSTILQGAWAFALHRCGGGDDIVFGTIRTGRYSALGGKGTRDMVGLLINTLPLRVRINPQGSALDALKEIRARALELRDAPYDHLSLAEIQQLSGAQRRLFETIFAFENFELNEAVKSLHPMFADWEVELREHIGYPLALEAYAGARLKLCLEYSREFFDAAAARRILSHVQTLLEGILRDASTPIARLPILPESERRLLLEAWNDTQIEYPQKCVHELFEEQAERTPESVAVIYEQDRLTYRELNRRANQLAHELTRLGVGPEALVGVYMERSPEMIVGLLGILKAGGAYVPIDPAYPEERRNYILEDSGAQVVLTQSKFAAEAAGRTVVVLDQGWERFAAHPAVNPPRRAGLDNLAYMIYTSGSTGKPKGALIEHRGLTNYLNWCLRAYPQNGRGSPVHSSLSFDLTVTSIYPALLSGKAVWMLPETANIEALAQIIKREADFSLIKITPAHLKLLSEQLSGADVRGKTRAFVIGGENLTAEHVNFWLENAPDTLLINEYGPTETVVGCCVYVLPRGAKPQGIIPIGKPIDNTQLYALDEHLQPVPIGVTGELFIGGAGVARGYWNRPDLTEERFIPNPFGAGRLYKTGDRVRWRADGSLEFLGRLDDQVKVRGYRVELGEVESALLEHASVRQAAVIAEDDLTGGKRLIAYVAGNVDIPTLRDFLRRKLPEYMLPSLYVPMDVIPLTPNGKVDRKALPAPSFTDQNEGNFVPPQTETERTLAGLWSDVLGVRLVGANHNFFELGGHSLSAVRLFARAREAFGVELPLGDIFDTASLAELAQRIDSLRQTLKPTSASPSRPPRLPLSLQQERLWFLHQIMPPRAVYNVPLAFRLRGKVDRAALQASLSALAARHESLRTRFAVSDGIPHQQIDPPHPIPLQETHTGTDWQDGLRAEVNRPFDLSREPLFRASLLTIAEDDAVLLLVLHHMITDGWSAEILKRELSALYNARVTGGEASLPPLPIQYADYALRQREWLQSDSFQTQRDFWRSRLKDTTPVLELPADRPRPAVQTYRGATREFPLPGDLYERFKAFSAEQGVTPFMALMAAFQVLLFRYSRQTQFAVGVPAANRAQPHTDDLIGFFVNTLAFPADLTDDPVFLDLLQRVREVSVGAFANQEFPFDRLVDDLRLERDLSRNALFQTMFSLQTAPASSLTLSGAAATELFLAAETSKFDLTFFINEKQQGAVLAIEYSADLFDPETIERMAAHYTCLLESILAEPRQRASRLNILPEAERRLLLEEWNNTQAEYPQKCIHELIEEQAERTPDAVAVVFEGESLTYRALNRRANQLAHELIRRGVGPDALVGVCMERSLEMVAALLGVLKAGGAYVPIDPAYPEERRTFMMEDSGVSILLTQTALLPLLQARTAAAVLCVDELQAFAAQPVDNPPLRVRGEHLAYMIYTSGSTGKPKGALNTHAGIFNRLYWMQSEYQLTPDDRVLQKTPFSFDVSVWEFFLPLMFGARLVVAKPEGHKDPQYLVDLIQREGVTTLHFVPSMLYSFLETPGASACAGIRRVICSGEALPVELANRFFKVLRAELHNLYGPTEAAIDVSYWACQPEEARPSVPLGKPVANTRLYVLDEHLQPAPIGIPGELHIAGIQVGRGYLNRPELTAEKFIEDPFHGGRMYKTGDLCRVLPDGNIEFLGRLDFQVKIRGFRIELGEIEAVLAKHPLVRQAVVAARREANGQHRLIAYFTVAENAGANLDEVVADVRAFLKNELPDYMIPAVFMPLDSMPLNPNGKIDRKALPEPRLPVSASEFVPPQTEAERAIADIWRELLGAPQVGRNANFFELGGDSILSLQFVSRAQAMGWYLTPRHVFEAQTVEALARIAGQGGRVQAEQGLALGHVPLTPIQHWFFGKNRANPHHFNQSALLELNRTADANLLSRAFESLFRHHDALRARFERTPGGWRQSVAETQPIEGIVRRVDVSALSADEREACLKTVNREIQTSLNIHHGPLLRAALFDAGSSEAQRLLIVVHHLVVDFVSWQILIHDLWMAYDQLAAGGDARLPEKTSSFKAWAEWLRKRAHDKTVTGELAYWLKIHESVVRPLPVDYPQKRDQARASDAEIITVRLSAPETRALLREVHHAYHTQVADILLTALADTFFKWTGEPNLLIDLEGHGRESETLDVSRTVGWFTSLFPVRLQLRGDDPGARIRAVKDQLRRIPQKGMGYGLLRYLNAETAPRLANLPKAEVLFNYGGQLKTVNVKALGGECADEERLEYLFNISGAVVDDQLTLSWEYSRELYRRETAANLAQEYLRALRDLIGHCLSAAGGGYRPEDFPLAGLSQSELDAVIGHTMDVADMYPLAPMQAVILEQSLAKPGSEAYFTQTGFEIAQPLDAARFRQAWERVVERHDIFRTRFVWENLKQPLQLVQGKAALVWDEQDWRGVPASETARWVNGLLRRERRNGFDLSQSPPVRFTLIRMEDDLYQFFWHCHHLLMDGWSYPLILREVAKFYADPSAYLPEPHPYREYIEWLARQEIATAEAFWREALSGVSRPTPLPGQRRALPNEPPEYREDTILLSAPLSESLQSFAHRHRLTLNVLFQASWALTLHRHGGENDVVFGVVVSGRSAPLAGIESRVGLFINALPARVRVSPDDSALEWLRAVMANQVRLEQFAYTPPHVLERCAGVAAGQPLFNSAVRFQNYPLSGAGISNAGLRIQNATGVDWWHYPLNLVVVPDSRVKLTLSYDAHLLRGDAVRRMLQTMESFLTRLPAVSKETALRNLLSR